MGGVLRAGCHQRVLIVSRTIKQVRLALAALKKAGVITTRSTNVHTIISVCNFDSYTI